MAQYKYSTKIVNDDNTAKAVGRNLPISTKQSIEVCNMIRKMNVEKAKKRLNTVIVKKQAVPFKRFNGDVGHKPGIGPGRYPVNCCTTILELLESATANAQFKGLNATSLVIAHISAQKGPTTWHHGRKKRQRMKRTSVEVVVEEIEPKKPRKKQQTPVKTEKPVKETIKEEKKSSVPDKKEKTKEVKK